MKKRILCIFWTPTTGFFGGFTVHKNEKTIDFSSPQAENFRGFTKHKTKKTVDFSPPQAKKIREIS